MIYLRYTDYDPPPRKFVTSVYIIAKSSQLITVKQLIETQIMPKYYKIHNEDWYIYWGLYDPNKIG